MTPEQIASIERANALQARYAAAMKLLREALTLREIGDQGPFKTRVREFLRDAGEAQG